MKLLIMALTLLSCANVFAQTHSSIETLLAKSKFNKSKDANDFLDQLKNTLNSNQYTFDLDQPTSGGTDIPGIISKSPNHARISNTSIQQDNDLYTVCPYGLKEKINHAADDIDKSNRPEDTAFYNWQFEYWKTMHDNADKYAAKNAKSKKVTDYDNTWAEYFKTDEYKQAQTTYMKNLDENTRQKYMAYLDAQNQAAKKYFDASDEQSKICYYVRLNHLETKTTAKSAGKSQLKPLETSSEAKIIYFSSKDQDQYPATPHVIYSGDYHVYNGKKIVDPRSNEHSAN